MTQSSWPSSSNGIPLERVQRLLPAVEHHAADLVAAARFEAGLVGVLPREPQELPLQLDRGARAERRRRRPSRGSVGSCDTVRIDGTGPTMREVLVDEVVLDHREHDRGRAAP